MPSPLYFQLFVYGCLQGSRRIALERKCQDTGERHGFSVEIALDEAAFRVAEEFDLLGLELRVKGSGINY